MMVTIYNLNMSYQNEKIGMMDEAYFVSRGDILKWLNDLLQLNLTKIEQLGSGAAYCQIIDVVHPGKITISKVNWKAKSDYQFIGNYRILQDSFNKIGIKRHIEVEKLAKAKYQDNLEFAQWLKRYYDLNCGDRGNNYLAEERRGGTNPNFGFAEKNVVPKMYNASGMIVPKKESPPKKKEVVTEAPPPKKTLAVSHTTPVQTRTSTDVSSRQVRRPQKKDVVSSPREKEESVCQRQKWRQLEENYQGQKQQREKQLTSLMQSQEQMMNRQKSLREREKEMAKRLKEMEDKLLMINEILETEQGAQLKIQMISQVAKVQQKQQQQEQEEPF